MNGAAPWPKTPGDQVTAIRQIVLSAPHPLSASDIA